MQGCIKTQLLSEELFISLKRILISDLTTLYRTAYNAHAFTTEIWLMCVWRVVKRAKSEMTNELMIASITSGFVQIMTLCYFLWNRRGFSLKFRPATLHHSPYSKQTCTAVGFLQLWVLLMRLVWSFFVQSIVFWDFPKAVIVMMMSLYLELVYEEWTRPLITLEWMGCRHAIWRTIQIYRSV